MGTFQTQNTSKLLVTSLWIIFSHPAGMHISNLVYYLTRRMSCVVERPWPLASQQTPDAKRALCHVFLLVIKDKTRLCECHIPPGDLPSSSIKERVRWTATAENYTSHPLLCNLKALSSSEKHREGERCGTQSKGTEVEKGKERTVCCCWATKAAHSCSAWAVCWSQQ